MRILRISLRNIASLAGTHTVDFTREPLRSAGLFAISGPTGSGKSSLLDALCLALYDDTPRLRPVGRLAELANGEKQNDPRNLLRRGTAEGFAEVAFVGVDNQIYTARWSVRRSRNKADGALQSAEMALYRGDIPPGSEGTLEQGGKKTEVREAIDKKIGLTFPQFTRAVLLAQNDFATFLKADDKDRAEILQALTGTERFEEISRAVFARCRSEETAVAEIEHRLAGNAPLSPEDRTAAEAVCVLTETALSEMEAKLAASLAHAAWFAQLAEFTDALNRAETELKNTELNREAAAPRRMELQHTNEAALHARPLRDEENTALGLTQAAENKCAELSSKQNAAKEDLDGKTRAHAGVQEAFAAARKAREEAQPLLLRARDLDSKIAPLAESLAKAQRESAAVAGVINKATARRDELTATRHRLQEEQSTVAARHHTLIPLAAFAQDAQAWLDRLDQEAKTRLAHESAGKELVRLVNAEAAQASLVAAERKQEPGVRTASAEARTALEKAEAAVRVHDGDRIAAERGDIEMARKALHGLHGQLREQQNLTAQLATLRQEITEIESANKTDAGNIADLKTTRLPDAETKLAGAREAWELAAAAVDAASVRLRETLRTGLPCPVCGSGEHPFETHPPAEDAVALRALKKGITEKEKARDALREQITKLETAVHSRAVQITAKSKAQELFQTQLETLRAERHDHAECAAVLALPGISRLPAAEDRLRELQERHSQLEAADSARRAAEKMLGECRVRHETASLALTALEKRLSDFDSALSTAKAKCEAARTASEKARLTHDESLTGLQPLLTSLTGASFAEDPAQFRQWFAIHAAEFLSLEKRLRDFASEIKAGTAALEPAEQSLAKAREDQKTRKAEEIKAAAAHDELRQQRTELFNGRAAEEVEAELNAALAGKEQTLKARADEVAAADKQLTAAGEAFKAAEETRLTANSRFALAAAALDSWLTAFSASTGRALDRAGLEVLLARDAAWCLAERAALETLESAVKSAEGARKVHQESLAKHTAARPTEEEEAPVTAAVTEHRAAREEAVERRDAARVVILNDDQRRRANQDLASQLSSCQAKAGPWIKLNDLIGSADGAKFRSIAQRRTLDILLGYANAQLELLAARYRLERLPESLNLIVLDRDMGDERRGVHSLSGGESFLVSLALALGLASLTSNRLRIESLFIDEGFGSLDPETLNTAMSALMHLEAQGRKVGVISHVTEMADAIPVQIRIVKGRGGASRLVVPGAEPELEPPVCEAEPATAELAARMLSLLQAAGGKLSAAALRKELGCSEGGFKTVRESLGAQIITEGRSLRLAEPQAS